MFLIFSANRECYFASDNGYSYIGTQNVSISGKPCINWLDIDPGRYRNTNRFVGNFEVNQCRVSDEEHHGSVPECFVGKEEVEKCAVKICGNCFISITRQCNLHALTPYFYIVHVRLGITGVYIIISYFCYKTYGL